MFSVIGPLVWQNYALLVLICIVLRQPLLLLFLFIPLVHTNDPMWDAALRESQQNHIVMLILIWLVGKKIPLNIFPILGVANALYMLYNSNGFLLNASMSGCFQACLIPICSPAVQAILAMSVLLTCKNQPIALLGVWIAITLIRRGHWKLIIPASLATVLAGYLLIGHMFLNSEGRYELWKMAFSVWSRPLLGMGFGSFYVIGPAMTLPVWHMGFLWLHSDWLQIGFETGIVGLAGVLAFYIYTLCRARGPIFDSLLIFGCFGLANFPLHQPFSAVLGSVLIAQAFRRKSHPHSQGTPLAQNLHNIQSYLEHKFVSLIRRM